MPLWTLTPLDLDDPNWEASSHRGPVLVRAPNEKEAREVAGRAFDIKTRFPPGQGMHSPPWLRPTLVTARRVDDPRFEADGPTALLEPVL